MTDYPIPDDLLKQMYVATGHGAGGAPIIPRRHVDVFLAALAEWADGSLIDPDGWRRIDARHPDGIDYCPIHDEPDIEGCDLMGECWTHGGTACRELPLYTLTDRGDQ